MGRLQVVAMLNKTGESYNTWKLIVLKASESCPDHSTVGEIVCMVQMINS